ncbi:ClpP/crotonase-like domain-containing protein, partial [Blyttiomyces helicus]
PHRKVYTVQFNRPKTLNALTSPMGSEFMRICASLASIPVVRAVVLTGSGRAFSAGGDLKFLWDRTRTPPDENAEIMRGFYGMFLGAVRTIPVPTIAAINGHAVGAGLCLALACDLRIAASNAKLGVNFVRLGLHPGMGATHTLPYLLPPQAAARLLLTGDLIDASEAASLGLVLKSVSADDLHAETLALARRIASASPVAVRATLKTLRIASGTGIDAALQREADAQAVCYAMQDMQEGLQAIEGKREPMFADVVRAHK